MPVAHCFTVPSIFYFVGDDVVCSCVDAVFASGIYGFDFAFQYTWLLFSQVLPGDFSARRRYMVDSYATVRSDVDRRQLLVATLNYTAAVRAWSVFSGSLPNAWLKLLWPALLPLKLFSWQLPNVTFPLTSCLPDSDDVDIGIPAKSLTNSSAVSTNTQALFRVVLCCSTASIWWYPYHLNPLYVKRAAAVFFGRDFSKIMNISVVLKFIRIFTLDWNVIPLCFCAQLRITSFLGNTYFFNPPGLHIIPNLWAVYAVFAWIPIFVLTPRLIRFPRPAPNLHSSAEISLYCE